MQPTEDSIECGRLERQLEAANEKIKDLEYKLHESRSKGILLNQTNRDLIQKVKKAQSIVQKSIDEMVASHSSHAGEPFHPDSKPKNFGTFTAINDILREITLLE